LILTQWLFQVDRKSVCFIKFIIEAYDGIAFMRTINPLSAEIELNIAPGCEPEAKKLLLELGEEITIRKVNN